MARRSRHPLLNDPNELAARIANGASLLGLARELGCDRGTVRGALVRHGITWDRNRQRDR